MASFLDSAARRENPHGKSLHYLPAEMSVRALLRLTVLPFYPDN
jgi:hypothetical protein